MIMGVKQDLVAEFVALRACDHQFVFAERKL